LANDNEQTCPAPRASKAKQGRRSARNRTAQVRGSLSLVNAGGTRHGTARHGVARALTAVAAASPTQAQRSRAEPSRTKPHRTTTPARDHFASSPHRLYLRSRVCSGPASPPVRIEPADSVPGDASPSLSGPASSSSCVLSRSLALRRPVSPFRRGDGMGRAALDVRSPGFGAPNCDPIRAARPA
jgi:hypothetical protein